MSIVLAIAPVFAVMILGYFLNRGGLPDHTFWPQADRLVYWVLMPVLLFHMNSTVSFTGEMAADHTRRLARDEGIFAGYSAGANLAAAVQLLRGPERGGTVAILICDSGLKYMSTDLWG